MYLGNDNSHFYTKKYINLQNNGKIIIFNNDPSTNSDFFISNDEINNNKHPK